MATPEAGLSLLREKLEALSRAPDAAFEASPPLPRDVDHHDAGGVEAGGLVRAVLLPYGGSCVAEGGCALLRRDVMTTLVLFLHELATNSLKYGALSRDGGKVAISWTARGDALELTWRETGGPEIAAPPDGRGFGSGMVDRIVRSAGGVVERDWRPEGLAARLRLPGCVLS